ncbi:MAG: GNAT family N-acetyltransferase [Clostridia bacterium]|nr:GNAT family N-acetyltransferase [Clostridia bacterium]
MRKIAESEYKNYTEFARAACSRAYPMSIAEGFQAGDIFESDGGDAALFWHYCGLAHLSGKAPEGFLEEIYALLISEEKARRLVLITDDGDAIRYFRDKGAAIGARAEYVYDPQSAFVEPPDCERFRIEEINEDNISKIEGRIVPSFSWDSAARFLSCGFGYVAFDGDLVCAVAFSSAVSSEETDIGVETSEGYRRRNLASFLAKKTCERIVGMGKKPVWAHDESNIASARTAQRCGFVLKKTNAVIRKPAGIYN